MPLEMPYHQVSFEEITKDLIRPIISHKLKVEYNVSKHKQQPDLHTKYSFINVGKSLLPKNIYTGIEWLFDQDYILGWCGLVFLVQSKWLVFCGFAHLSICLAQNVEEALLRAEILLKYVTKQLQSQILAAWIKTHSSVSVAKKAKEDTRHTQVCYSLVP